MILLRVSQKMAMFLIFFGLVIDAWSRFLLQNCWVACVVRNHRKVSMRCYMLFMNWGFLKWWYPKNHGFSY